MTSTTTTNPKHNHTNHTPTIHHSHLHNHHIPSSTLSNGNTTTTTTTNVNNNSGYLKALIPPLSIRTIIACLAWYSVSSLTSQLTKLILTRCTYPLFLAQSQSLICTCLALLFILIIKQFPQISTIFPQGSIPHDLSKPIFNLSVFLKVLPLGLFQFVGRYFSLNATSLISLATVSSIKALSPLLIVAGYRIIYNVKFPIITYLSLTPLLIGVLLMILSDSIKNPNSNSNLLTNEKNELNSIQIKGLIFCLISTIIFAGQNIYGKQLMTWDNTSRIVNPASLVLNTETTRPNSPIYKNGNMSPPGEIKLPIGNNNNNHENGNSFLNGANNILSKFVRQRNYTNSLATLPYSTSDLKLDEKFEYSNNSVSVTPPKSTHDLSQTYNHTVRQSNTSVYNPFAFIIEKFELDKVTKPDQITIILYCSIIGFIFSFTGFVWEELNPLLNEFNKSITEVTSIAATNQYNFLSILSLIVLDSLSFFIQTLLSFHLLGSIPALSYSIASMMKRIVIITVSIVMAIGATTAIPIPPLSSTNPEDPQQDQSQSPLPPPPSTPSATHTGTDINFSNVTNEQFLGLLLIGIGLYSYDRWGSRGLKGSART
ncbi:member of triose phosphate translocator family [Scheffersomyces coipomensis]|uniref:member of triose phosphate translocator family n=1 Tax=Scheffersomyces coipomensis TaxID=1788519 RepID=UPI00315D1AF9